MCVVAAYGVQCLVTGCRGSGAGQQVMCPGKGMLHDCAASLFLDAYSLELLMMGIEVPETC